jgi:hypothetical protein
VLDWKGSPGGNVNLVRTSVNYDHESFFNVWPRGLVPLKFTPASLTLWVGSFARTLTANIRQA